MTSLPPGPPGTPPRALSQDPSPLPRNPMADADDSVKRKRPRLDSGGRAHRSMSADPSLPAPTGPDPPPPQLHLPSDRAGDRDTTSTTSPTATPSPQPLEGSPSKVTINVRDSSLAASPTQDAPLKANMTPQDEESPTLAQMKLSDEPSKDQDPIMVVSSSEEGSPQIEAAEPEDMHTHTGPTVWHTAGDASDAASEDLDVIMSEFPYINTHMNLAEGVDQLSLRLKHSERIQPTRLRVADYAATPTTEPVLSRLSEWIDRFLGATQCRLQEWFDICVATRDFWDYLPMLLYNLCERRIVPDTDYPLLYADGVNGNGEQGSPSPISKFLVSFASLTARMLSTDLQTLRDTLEDTSVSPDLLGSEYVKVFRRVMSFSHPFMRFQDNLAWPIDEALSVASETLIQGMNGGISCLTQQIVLLLGRNPLDAESTCQILELTRVLEMNFARALSGEDATQIPIGLRNGTHQAALWSLFQTVDTHLQDLICKQNSALNIDNLKRIIDTLDHILLEAVQSFETIDTTDLIPEEYRSELDGLSAVEKGLFVLSSWKMQILKKCIMQGRMDSRALGVDMMCEHLVHTWTKFIKNRIAEPLHIVPRFLSDFILQNGIVAYLVGVESHTQLVSRSKNVIGFLLVAHRYSKKETDIIWKSILSSQDPRFAESVMSVAQGIVELMPQEVVSYWLEKVDELPVKRFELHYFRLFSEMLTNNMARVQSLSTSELNDLGIHFLYVRLIRGVYTEPSITREKRIGIIHWAIDMLRKTLQPTLRASDRESIYTSCIKNISEGSNFSTGSITVLNRLLDASTPTQLVELQMLEAKFGLTNEMVKDFMRFHDAIISSETSDEDVVELSKDRLNLLKKIINCLPESLTPELTKDLWDNLVGDQGVSDMCRDTAWRALTRAVTDCQSRPNSFIEMVLHEHFPKLPSHCFTLSVFPFVIAATNYAHSLVPETEHDREIQRNINAGELFWPVSLKAKPTPLANQAIEKLVETQLKSQDDQVTDIGKAMDAHAFFVARAVQYLISSSQELQRLTDGSASGEEDAMVIIATDDEVAAARLRFMRSLAILQRFVQQAREHRSLSPDLSVKSSTSSEQTTTEMISLCYQPHVGGKPLPTRTMKISESETYATLLEQIKDATGFSKFILIAGGQKVDQEKYRATSMRDMEILRTGGLILVQKQPGSKSDKIDKTMGGLNRIELEIMKHFQVLYDLLSLDDELSEHVYRFLSIFPPHADVTSLVYDTSKSAAVVFPLQSVYKAMYSVHVLRAVLDQYLSEGAAPQDLLTRAVHVLVAAIMDLSIPDQNGLTRTEVSLVRSYISCLMKVLRERMSPEVSRSYFAAPDALMRQLRILVDKTVTEVDEEQVEMLVKHTFATMLEASAHDEKIWAAFKAECLTYGLLQKLLLACHNFQVRSSTRVSIQSFLAASSTSQQSTTEEFAVFFWETISSMIPQACTTNCYPDQLFASALELFRRLNNLDKSELPLQDYIYQWSKLLTEHDHQEFIGRFSVDNVVCGLAGLLEWCLKMMMSDKKPLELPQTLASDVFHDLLFPRITLGSGDDAVPESRIAVLDAKTREHLYQILLATAGDMTNYGRLLDTIRGLNPSHEQSNAWSWGLASLQDERSYGVNWEVDRLHNIRATTGYAGLKNLQNTCYMNSLLTQLFMNIGFREFLLRAHVSDPHGEQKLLWETQRLLGCMQDTWLKAVDPENVTDVLVTYEGTPVDVSIQMDVDEFYNLLFDRWESQLLSSDEKKEFRSFYGGEIVQQIKSKDCPHVSERVETFSAIQCDIQGKATLAESLNAYVGGEMMEGDNKYSCSTCGSYVDAVKRACFKHLPDNLIFHLKRFDYDLMMGTRSKINDRFEFPDQIDMAPYLVDHLQDPDQPVTADEFTLVGVLVHSGSAEAGHYYSYIRERPCSLGTWLEFNDSEVTAYNPANMENGCFGGWQEQYFQGVMHFPRTWNAYMLFYQRTSTLTSEFPSVDRITEPQPPKVNIPQELKTPIALDNLQFLRMFCLFGPEHGRFTRALFDKYARLSKDSCSDDHRVENDLLRFGLQHITHVFARQKDCAELYPVMDHIAKLSLRCIDCCKCLHAWLVTHVAEFRMLLLRCPIEQVRRSTSNLILHSLQYLREQDPEQYGLPDESSPADDPMDAFPDPNTSIYRVVGLFREVLQYLPQHARGWDDFYSLLTRIAHLGAFECEVLHQEGFLGHCLEILVLTRNKSLVKALPQHASFVRHLDRRAYSMIGLVQLFQTLLQKADFGNGAESEQTMDRGIVARRCYYTLTERELELIEYCDSKSRIQGLAFLEEILLDAGEASEVYSPIVCLLVRQFPTGRIRQRLFNTVISGVNVSPSSLHRPFLQAALAFCATSRSQTQIRDMYGVYAKDVVFDDYHGIEYLDFFMKFRGLYNEHFRDERPNLFRNLTLTHIHAFGPPLLYSRESRVRRDTLTFLKLVLFSNPAEDMTNEEEFGEEEVVQARRKFCKQCLLHAERLITHNEVVSMHRIAETQQVLAHARDVLLLPKAETGSPNQTDVNLRHRYAGALAGLDTISASSPEEIGSNAEFDSDDAFSDTSNVNYAP